MHDSRALNTQLILPLQRPHRASQCIQFHKQYSATTVGSKSEANWRVAFAGISFAYIP